MDFKGHIIDQKGFIKRYKKGQHVEFLDLIYLFFSGLGGYPPPPLTENHPAQKPLAEMGGNPHLNGKNLRSSF